MALATYGIVIETFMNKYACMRRRMVMNASASLGMTIDCVRLKAEAVMDSLPRPFDWKHAVFAHHNF